MLLWQRLNFKSLSFLPQKFQKKSLIFHLKNVTLILNLSF
ncbi:hypothetical protein ATCC51561_1389 [Campylobacter concisus ATCC 51561]|nr:hypothetical protein ATCC51561_1389 [Campylobacter concisus ATCC 51561]